MIAAALAATPATIPLAVATGSSWSPHDSFLLASAAGAMAGLVALITLTKAHPFVALVIASIGLGLTVGLPPEKALSAFQKGMGETLGSVGVVIALGTMLGKLLEASGGADRIVTGLVGRASPRVLPWAMALGAMIIGVPMFFETGVVLLMPIILLVAKRSGQSTLRVGMPALAGLSVLHGLVPPHPAPLVATSLLGADVGRTLAYGLLIAVPTIAVSGPLFGSWIGGRITGDPSRASALASSSSRTADDANDRAASSSRREPPRIGTVIALLLLPVALMMLRAAVDVVEPRGKLRGIADFAGHPLIALLVAVVVATFVLGSRSGRDAKGVGALLGESLGPIAGIVMIVGAGGGFKETLIEAGVGAAIGNAASGSALPPLLLAWLIAVSVRIATGSATVATITASGIMAPLVPTLHGVDPALLALAVGSGSLFFSHVNDAGFWLVKEYFGMTVTETLASWSLMETLISVAGITCVLGLGAMRP